eukprot:1180619-Prorocentrum_minimum.AAC.1
MVLADIRRGGCTCLTGPGGGGPLYDFATDELATVGFTPGFSLNRWIHTRILPQPLDPHLYSPSTVGFSPGFSLNRWILTQILPQPLDSHPDSPFNRWILTRILPQPLDSHQDSPSAVGFTPRLSLNRWIHTRILPQPLDSHPDSPSTVGFTPGLSVNRWIHTRILPQPLYPHPDSPSTVGFSPAGAEGVPQADVAGPQRGRRGLRTGNPASGSIVSIVSICQEGRDFFAGTPARRRTAGGAPAA